MIKLTIPTIEDIPNAAIEFLDEVGHRKIFAFDAQMGAGKTTFILGLLKAMGVRDFEGSPTYSLVNVYDTEMYGKIYHFDLYRINDELEALDIGLEEMVYGDNICFIEWPEKVKDLLPHNTIWSYISVDEVGSRTLTIDK